MSEHFDGHVGRHMPLVFAKTADEPWVEITLCQNVARESRPEVALYNVHVMILSSKDAYDLQDNRLEFIADGVRISLASGGMVESVPREQAANYPISVQDLRTLAAVATGKAPGPESSILKIKGTEIQQSLDALFVEAAGYYALPFVPEQYVVDFPEEDRIGHGLETRTSLRYFNNRKATIYAGSNEIQKNIIAKHVLGL